MLEWQNHVSSPANLAGLARPRGLSAERGRVHDLDAPHAHVPLRIAFGSCNREYQPQTHYDAIAAQRPDLWIWLGDNVYGDTTNETELRDKYAQVLAAPSYRRFVDCTAVVTWTSPMAAVSA